MRIKKIYTPHGVCAMKIQYELDENNRVYNVRFVGGCPGNGAGVARLVEGMPAQDVIKTLSGIDCGGRGTSCPDQLARALKEALGG
jgi:uncharacterized protein (TIGR03905 family)